MKDLNKLAKEVYENNKAKGFHSEKHSVDHMMCLVISELMEAVEADREGRMADAECVKALINKAPRSLFDVLFKNGVKDTVEDELADAVIRLLDTAGALGVRIKEIEKENNLDYYATIGFFEDHLFTERVIHIIDKYFNSINTIEWALALMIFNIEILCEVMGIPLWRHVDMKLKYNKLRPYKHGKNY